MKKIMLFIVFGVLFSFGSNMFGYTWTVQNWTGTDNINVTFCTTPGADSCQVTTIPAGATHTFSFDEWYNKGLLFGSAVVNGQNFDAGDFGNQTGWTRTSGGNVRVVKKDGGYAFEVID